MLLVEDDYAVARDWAERGIAAARAADAPWVEADALVTLGFMSNREGRNDEAIKLLTAAHKQAREARVLGVELRSAYHLARAHLERGDLAVGGAIAHEGTTRASQAGLNMSSFGVDLQHLHFQCHFADGKWDHAQEIADGFPVRVTTPPEAYLSSMALFIDVARGNPAAEERRSWIEPFWSTPGFDEFTARGLLAEHALWQGDTERALTEAQVAIQNDNVPPWGYSPSVIRPAAVALAARAERAIQARAVGDDQAAEAEMAAAPICCGSPGREPSSPSGPSSSWAPRGVAGWPGPRPNTAGPAATTIRRPGRPCWTRSAPPTCTRSPGPGGGWPRRWPRRAAVTRPTSSGAWRPRPRTGSAPGRCGPRWPTWPAGPGSARCPTTSRTARRSPR